MSQKVAIIIGAGPAGLTAGYELLNRTHIKPIIFNAGDQVGGLARTINYSGYKFEIGGHRFFSKSDRVMQWWLNILPLQKVSTESEKKLLLTYQNKKKEIYSTDTGPDPDLVDRVMLVRNRLTRIYHQKKFYDYPIKLNLLTVKNLGGVRIIKIALSYIQSRLFPIKPVKSLEDFFINRFGRELYVTFFKDYTEKVWGVSCDTIKPEWGSQRVKGLSISKAISQAVKNIFKKNKSLEQKDLETSLIERFLYPKFGPGQMWEEVAKLICSKGGEIHLRQKCIGLHTRNEIIESVDILDMDSNMKKNIKADYIISTMPVNDLIDALGAAVPEDIKNVSKGLCFRDYILVALIIKKMKKPLPDTWIYVQEKGVKLGRIQIYTNWSPYMVKDKDIVLLGCEYFCTAGDELWRQSTGDLIQLAIQELEKIDIVNKEEIIDGTVIKEPKTYPAYFGTYDQFHYIRDFVDAFENLFLIGRNGMHRYNNQDHSMLTAMTAVDNMVKGITTKDNIWAVNTEMEYHEVKKE